jgi:hypothetical protein
MENQAAQAIEVLLDQHLAAARSERFLAIKDSLKRKHTNYLVFKLQTQISRCKEVECIYSMSYGSICHLHENSVHTIQYTPSHY